MNDALPGYAIHDAVEKHALAKSSALGLPDTHHDNQSGHEGWRQIGRLSGRLASAPTQLGLLAGSREGLALIPAMVAEASDAALSARHLGGPLPCGAAADVLAAVRKALGPSKLAEEGIGTSAALRHVARVVTEYGIDLAHPRAAAHLQPPTLSVAVVADLLASISNASLDTYDSGPSAIAFEQWLIAVLKDLAGYAESADGVLTPGGSLSNMLGLLLARDAIAWRLGHDARRHGIAALPQPTVLCSELAHFSVQRACAALGLGEDAVHVVAADEQHRMSIPDLRATLAHLRSEQRTIVAIVATAGTTDFGSIDPLHEIAALAKHEKIWLHVDAAYGFGALFSKRLAARLSGIREADSITVDLHKIGWQPAACSVLLVRDAQCFRSLEREVAYLNPPDDGEAGLDGLLGRSLQTTRRPDAVKAVATLLAFGKKGMGEMVDRCHDLARYAQWRLTSEAELELVAPAELTTVVFRFRCRVKASDAGHSEDHINAALRRRLVAQGVALIGRTVVRHANRDCVCLKLTLLNPTASYGDIDDLVELIKAAGREESRRHEAGVQ